MGKEYSNRFLLGTLSMFILSFALFWSASFIFMLEGMTIIGLLLVGVSGVLAIFGIVRVMEYQAWRNSPDYIENKINKMSEESE
jgi:hypothetical protein